MVQDSVDSVPDFLETLGLGHLIEAFEREGIDFVAWGLLEEEDYEEISVLTTVDAEKTTILLAARILTRRFRL